MVAAAAWAFACRASDAPEKDMAKERYTGHRAKQRDNIGKGVRIGTLSGIKNGLTTPRPPSPPASTAQKASISFKPMVFDMEIA